MNRSFIVLLTLGSIASEAFAKTSFIQNLTVESNSAAPNSSSLPAISPALAPIRLGLGYNSLGGHAYSTRTIDCLNAAPDRVTKSSLRAEVEFSLTPLQTAEEFKRFVLNSVTSRDSVETDVEALTPLYDLVNSFKSDAHSLHYQEHSNYLALRIKREVGSDRLSTFHIDQPTKYYFNARPKEFFGKCGDRFLSEIRKGAEVDAILECTPDTSAEKVAMDAQLKSGAITLADLSAESIQKSFHVLTGGARSTKSCRLIAAAKGGKKPLQFQNMEEFVTNALSYVANADSSSAKPIEIRTTSYSEVLDPLFANQVLDRVDLKLEHQREAIRDMNRRMDELESAMSTTSAEGFQSFARLRKNADNLAALEQRKLACFSKIENLEVCTSPVGQK